jgi:hypothetical protein
MTQEHDKRLALVWQRILKNAFTPNQCQIGQKNIKVLGDIDVGEGMVAPGSEKIRAILEAPSQSQQQAKI